MTRFDRTREGVGAVTVSLPSLECVACAKQYPVENLAWRCECGGLLDVAAFVDEGNLAAALDAAGAGVQGLWRYQAVLPVSVDAAVTMGEGASPLIPAPGRPNVRLKLDFMMPTLSFKDRGAVLLATLARRLGVERAVVDSSGNAGTSAAAYMARAGVPCEVFVPESTSPGKLAQMQAHGAVVRRVPGTRADTAAAVLDVADAPGVFYASHVYHPYFHHGVKTYAYEIWEQSGGRLPDTIVVPVGNGTMVLGCALAFEELRRAGLIEAPPKIVAVQSAHCAPLVAAMTSGSDTPVEAPTKPTLAEGIAIAVPPRGAQVLSAIRATAGAIISVTDEHVAAARADLAAAGLFVEPTSAVCWAAIRAADDETTEQEWGSEWARARGMLRAGDVVAPLCGAGLKSP